MKRLAMYYKDILYEQSYKNISHLTHYATKKEFRKILDVVKRKIIFEENDLIITLFSGYTDRHVKSIRRFIANNNINKIYFFIEDVFRLECQETVIDVLDTFSIEKYPRSTRAIELDIIQSIIKKTNINYEVYHCEFNCNFFEQQHNIKIKYFDWFSAKIIIDNILEEKNKFKDIGPTKKLSCFNLRKEIHRYLISTLLHHRDDVIISCNFKLSDEELTNNQALDINSFDTKIKEEILISHKNIDYNKLIWDTDKATVEKNSWIELSGKDQWKNLSAISSSFVNIVTETRFSSPMPCFNEKTLKPIIVRRPFILLAPPGTLSLLHRLGLKTFSKWWDEDYDQITDHVKRFEKVYKICLEILNKSTEDLEKMLKEMSVILDHNYKILNTFPEKMLDLN